jgi:hypothetical protein
MSQKILKVILLSLVVTLLPSNFQVANATEILWNPGLSNNLDSYGKDLIPGTKIRNTGFLIYKQNPDELIMQIIMDQSFEDMPFSGKGRNMAMWIYWPKSYCWSKEDANCDGLYTVSSPFNPSGYPNVKSSEYVVINKHDKASNINVKPTNCRAPWWIESTLKPRDTWSFAVSITCLGMPKEFGWYAFSEINVGQKEVATDFTSVQTITYPFHELAASAAAKNKESILPAQSKKQICVLAKTGKGYDEVIDFEEQCSDSNSQWEFTYCDSHTRSDLEVFQSKKWKKVRTVKSTKGYCDDPNLSNSFTHKSPLIGKYRIKSYGNTKFTPAYLNLEIYRKDIA